MAVAASPQGAAANRAAALVPVGAGARPLLLDDGDLASLREAIGQSLSWLSRQPEGQLLSFGSRVLTIAEQRASMLRMLRLLADGPSAEILHHRVLAEFDLVKSIGRDDGAVLVTGYHEPIIEAAEAPSAHYRVPILAAPPDLPEPGRGRYWTRTEIEQGRLNGVIRPLAWARDPVDVFFMEIEGSGTLRFPDGRELRVGYAATNGHPYRSIGRLLIQEGRISREAMTMRALRDWLTANPGEVERVLRHNESYVFFRPRSGSPVGSLGVELTPGRSIATDPRVFPRSALAFVRTIRPFLTADGVVVWRSVNRFVLNQDAGGVIRGPGRMDIFWGRGPEADLAASEMKEPGELFFVVPRAQGRCPGVSCAAARDVRTPSSRVGARPELRMPSVAG
jgi:membrane-bound lytic murein transglycosylase A